MPGSARSTGLPKLSAIQTYSSVAQATINATVPSPLRKAIDRMWFRRHWYWPSGYIVVGIIVALLTNNIHLSSLSGVLLSILAVLLWPFILGAALCRLLGFHIPGIDIT
jgi:hypothetical protein